MRDTEYKSIDKSNKVLAIGGDLLQIFQQVMPPLFRNFLSAYIQLLRRGLHHRTRIRRLLVATEAYFGLDRVFGSCLFRVLSGHVPTILDKFCRTIPLAWNGTMRLCQAFYQIPAPLLEYAAAHLTLVVRTIFLPVFRLIFDAAYPLLCDDIPPPETRRFFWSSFFSSPSCLTEEMVERQKECVFRISSVVLTAFATFVLGVVITTCAWSSRTSRLSKTWEVGVDRGTNTPAIGMTASSHPPA